MSYTQHERKKIRLEAIHTKDQGRIFWFFKFPILGAGNVSSWTKSFELELLFPPVSNFTVTLVVLYTDVQYVRCYRTIAL